MKTQSGAETVEDEESQDESAKITTVFDDLHTKSMFGSSVSIVINEGVDMT